MDSFSSRRQLMQEQSRRQRKRGWLGWALGVAAVIAIVGYLAYAATKPGYGQAFEIMDSTHVPEGSDPGPYNSDPPTSGHHYERELDPGLYEDSDVASMGAYPIGYLMHNLEHGYIVFWYNCDLLSAENCDTLKNQIRDYMENSSVRKLVAFPWHSTQVPLILTSWGYLLEMPTFDAREATRFINSNRMRAPEPNAE